MNIKTLLTLSLLVASFNAQSADTACPSGWTKSADGLTCVLETKTTQIPNQVSNTAKPVCISGFTYSSTSMKCEQINNASTYNTNKTYAYISGLKFGPNPVEDICYRGHSVIDSYADISVIGNKIRVQWGAWNYVTNTWDVKAGAYIPLYKKDGVVYTSTFDGTAVSKWLYHDFQIQKGVKVQGCIQTYNGKIRQCSSPNWIDLDNPARQDSIVSSISHLGYQSGMLHVVFNYSYGAGIDTYQARNSSDTCR